MLIRTSSRYVPEGQSYMLWCHMLPFSNPFGGLTLYFSVWCLWLIFKAQRWPILSNTLRLIVSYTVTLFLSSALLVASPELIAINNKPAALELLHSVFTTRQASKTMLTLSVVCRTPKNDFVRVSRHLLLLVLRCCTISRLDGYHAAVYCPRVRCVRCTPSGKGGDGGCFGN